MIIADPEIRLQSISVVVHGHNYCLKTVTDFYPSLKNINFLEDRFIKILAVDFDEALRKRGGLPGYPVQYGLVSLYIFTDCLKDIPNIGDFSKAKYLVK